MSYLLCDLTQKRVFQNGLELDCAATFPLAPPECAGVVQIRVRADGTIERYSVTDWAWKSAPELAGYVDQLRATHVDVATAIAAAAAVPAPKAPL